MNTTHAFRDPIPAIDPTLAPSTTVGMGVLGRLVFQGAPVAEVIAQLEGAQSEPRDPGLDLDLSIAYQMAGQRERALALQRSALERQQLYRLASQNSAPKLRVLMLVAAGDMSTNTPVEFILDGAPWGPDVQLDYLYILPGQPLPAAVPPHDVAFMAISQDDGAEEILMRLARIASFWPRPLINEPQQILHLSRDLVTRRLGGQPGLALAATERVGRTTLERLVSAPETIASVLAAGRFPLIVRPVGSHGGKGLVKVENVADLAGYLALHDESEFYLAPFLDYRSADGFFRKSRIAFIGGRPFLCHVAISNDWMIHFANAAMNESAVKREDEARRMASFDTDFAQRHATALRLLAERIGLDYFGIDCSELPDGRLLVFEVDSGMVIHAMDSPQLYAYKQAPMQRAFAAFHELLLARAGNQRELEAGAALAGARLAADLLGAVPAFGTLG